MSDAILKLRLLPYILCVCVFIFSFSLWLLQNNLFLISYFISVYSFVYDRVFFKDSEKA